MAVFNIKRGDSMPPLIISMRVAGTDPERFFDANKDDAGTGIDEDNAVELTTPDVKFIMTNLETGEIIGIPGNVANRFTGVGKFYEKTIGFEDPPINSVPIKKTLLRYNWQPPHANFDPTISSTLFGGDTLKAGVYKGEFELIYTTFPVALEQSKKRSFPSTPGDTLIINVLPDDNDKSVGETV